MTSLSSFQSLRKIMLLFFFQCIIIVTSFCFKASPKRRRGAIIPEVRGRCEIEIGIGNSSRLHASSSSSTTVPIIACSSNIEMERAISFYIKPGDLVLELGSQLNDISKLICSKIIEDGENLEKGGETATGGGHAVLFGLGLSKDAKSGRTKTRNSLPSSFYDRVTFQELEQFDEWRDAFNVKLDPEATGTNNIVSYDVMVLDVGTMIGNDLYLTALSIANEFIAYHNMQKKCVKLSNEDDENHNQRQRRPRVILIKSKILANFARRLIHSQRLLNGSSYMASKIRNSATPSSFIENHKNIQKEEVAPLKYTPRSSKPYIIAVVGVNEYRRTIRHIVRSGDEIIEVGCHFGQSTVLLHEAAANNHSGTRVDSSTSMAYSGNPASEQGDSGNRGFCIGVDIGPKIIEHAKTKYPHIPFAVGNAWNVLQLLKVKNQSLLLPKEENSVETMSSKLFEVGGYDLVYADIGGLSGRDGILESLSLLDSLGNSLEPRCIVIKSLCMNRLSSQLTAFSDVWHKIN